MSVSRPLGARRQKDRDTFLIGPTICGCVEGGRGIWPLNLRPRVENQSAKFVFWEELGTNFSMYRHRFNISKCESFDYESERKTFEVRSCVPPSKLKCRSLSGLHCKQRAESKDDEVKAVVWGSLELIIWCLVFFCGFGAVLQVPFCNPRSFPAVSQPHRFVKLGTTEKTPVVLDSRWDLSVWWPVNVYTNAKLWRIGSALCLSICLV